MVEAAPAGRRAASSWGWHAGSLICGALLTTAFAPFDLWPLALLCPALLMFAWRRADTAREAAWLGFAFGLGLFAAGTWWLYISIHGFGQAPVWVALLVMSALVLIMAAYYAGLGYAVVRWLPVRTPTGALLFMPAAWLLVEWWCGWFLSGFPWLSLGYSQTDTWLRGFAPLGGIHLISGLLLVGAGALVVLVQGPRASRIGAAVLLVAMWPAGRALDPIEWTQQAAKPSSVAIVQGAIPQDMKWLASNQQDILDAYARLHSEALGADLIVWPESALPDLANNLADYIGAAWSAAREHQSALLMGVMRLDDDQVNYYNSVLALAGTEPAFYDKHHLVPFAEFFPVPDVVREWLRLMSLPYSDFTHGAAGQQPLAAGALKVAANICYEDAYPGSLRGAMRRSDLIVTVTNDAWFGRSPARYQHFQIARLRAAEARRYLLRAANDGVSAVVGPRGEVRALAPEFKAAVLRGQILARTGDTPYLKAGNYPIIGASALIVMLGLWRRRKLPAGSQVYPSPSVSGD